MNRTHMIDQRLRHRNVRINFEYYFNGALAGLLIVMALITLSASIREIHNHYGENFINYDDFVLSDDSIDHMQKQGHGKNFSEQDID